MTTPFTYNLPGELIAQRPLPRRDDARLMVVCRTDGAILHRRFRDLPDLMVAGDILVVNDTRVIPARIPARKPTGGKAEVLLLQKIASGLWRVLIRGRVKAGSRLTAGDIVATVIRKEVAGSFVVEFEPPDDGAVLAHGKVPLPPYIKRQPDEADLTDYQTVFAAHPGSVAAPTAGLHFTPDLLQILQQKGIRIATITLSLGWASFKTSERAGQPPPPEPCTVPQDTAQAVNEAHRKGMSVTAVGTSSLRALETAATDAGEVTAFAGVTDLYIRPGWKFRVVDHLVTNFHLPGSSHLLLVAAFAGIDLAREAYETAVRERYRFYSYGDAMIIL